MKFGGSSVATAQAINQVVGIIHGRLREKPVVITSALAGITNLLLDCANFAAKRKISFETKILHEIEARHRLVLSNFSPSVRQIIEPELNLTVTRLQTALNRIHRQKAAHKKDLDLIASFGERMASWLLTGALQNQGLNAERISSRELVYTDSTFGAAEVDFRKTGRNFTQRILPLLRRKIIPVITGFIGVNSKGNTTTLGRGGSDYSAAIAAVCLNAKEIQIWKDVKGFMTADPRIIKKASVVPCLSFQEAAELSYFGAKLLHPKTIHPAIKKNIPVRILNTFAPKNPGTIIRQTSPFGHAKTPVRAISYKKNITIINVTSLRMLGPYGFMEKLFKTFAIHRIPVDVVATSEVSVSVTIEDSALTNLLIRDLKRIGRTEVRKKHVILSLVGSGLRSDPRVEAHIFEALCKLNIPTHMISKGASAINFTCIIEEKYFDQAIRALHKKFFS